MGNIIIKAFLSYIEKHPDVLEELVGQLVHAIIAELKKVGN
jgi:hypothetical protein